MTGDSGSMASGGQAGVGSILPATYLIFLGDAADPLLAKTAYGLRDWSGERCVAQWRLEGGTLDLGIPHMPPEEARAAGAEALLIGISTFGGVLPERWIPSLVRAVEAGLDLISGLHVRLKDVPALAQAAAAHGRSIFDVRDPGREFAVATGRKRIGRRLLTVGTDCALGKKYTALAIARALAAKGRPVDFRATGQTGIMISGGGIPMDAVVSDFIAGAAEVLSPDSAPDHWDIVEGQGSLFHPAYAGVTLGLLHGSQPDAIVLCHHPLRKRLNGYPTYPLPDPASAIELYLKLARLTNPEVRCVGLSLNASALDEAARVELMERYRLELNVPVCDPMKDGVEAILEEMER